MKNLFFGMFGLRMGWFMLATLLVIAGIVTAGVAIGIPVQRHFDRVACRSFAVNANRETKFVIYNFFSWDCLTPTGDGRWISTDNLREFGDNRP